MDSDGGMGLCWVLWCIYVDGFDGARDEIGVLWVCDVPVSYAEIVDYGYSCTSPGAQMCGTGFWVSK